MGLKDFDLDSCKATF